MRERFEAYCREHRKDLLLDYMYDCKENYQYDGYIWADTYHAFRMWCAAEEAQRNAV